MTPRIITADEARALLDASEAKGAWRAGTVEAEGKVWAHDTDALGGQSVGEVCVFNANIYRPHNGNRALAAAAPDLAATVVAHAAEIDRLRAIIDGRTTPPTDAEIRDVARAGLTVILHAIDARTGRIVDLRTRDVQLISVWATHHADGHFASAVWRLIDANDRPIAWPVPSEPR